MIAAITRSHRKGMATAQIQRCPLPPGSCAWAPGRFGEALILLSFGLLLGTLAPGPRYKAMGPRLRGCRLSEDVLRPDQLMR